MSAFEFRYYPPDPEDLGVPKDSSRDRRGETQDVAPPPALPSGTDGRLPPATSDHSAQQHLQTVKIEDQGAKVENHVDLFGAEINGLSGLMGFLFRSVSAERKTNHCDHFGGGSTEQLEGLGDEPGVDTDGFKIIFSCLTAVSGKVGQGRFGA